MPHILEEIGLDPADLTHHSTLVKWFDRIKTILWRIIFTPGSLCSSSEYRKLFEP